MSKIFIIVLNFNGGKKVLKCLNSLKKERAGIIVVDNDSFDNSPEIIKKKFPKVKVIKNDKNIGFAAGNNIGIQYALKQNADAVVLLNQDTIIGKSFSNLLFKNSADIVGPIIRFKRKGRLVYDYGGRINWLVGKTKHQESFVVSLSKKLNFHKPDYVSGCAMMIKRPVFEKIGLLDEKFFLYFEDVDFCQRAKKAGFKIAIEPKTIIFHELIEGKKKSFFQIYHLMRSNLIFINRYIQFWEKPIAYVYWWSLLTKILLKKLI